MRKNPFFSLFQALNSANVRYLIVGGSAMNLSESLPYRGDVEVVVASGELPTGAVMEAISLHVTKINPEKFDEHWQKRCCKDVGNLNLPFMSANDRRTLRLEEKSGADRDYLRRCKASTNEQRLEWLAAAWELVNEVKMGAKKPRKLPVGP